MTATAIEPAEKVVINVMTSPTVMARLTNLELRLLYLLLTHPGWMLETVYLNSVEFRAGGDSTLFKIYVYRPRKKIKQDSAAPRRILTEPGIGFRYQDQQN